MRLCRFLAQVPLLTPGLQDPHVDDASCAFMFHTLRRGAHVYTVLQPMYMRLPTGTVKPHGWGLDMAQVLAHGLASQQPVWYS